MLDECVTATLLSVWMGQVEASASRQYCKRGKTDEKVICCGMRGKPAAALVADGEDEELQRLPLLAKLSEFDRGHVLCYTLF